MKGRTQAPISRPFWLGSKHNRGYVHNGSKLTNASRVSCERRATRALPTAGASAAAGLHNVTTYEPKHCKNEYPQLENTQLGGRQQALVRRSCCYVNVAKLFG
jgi:hypothetical protein